MLSDQRIAQIGPPKRIDWIGIAQASSLIVLTCLCYWRTLDGGFFWDDHLFIPTDAAARPLALRDIWFSTQPYDYYPLTYTVFWLEWHLWGNNPLGYHAVGLLLGLADIFLVWAFLAALRLPGAWLGALLFAVHPLNVSSVAWIAESKNTLSAAFYLLCLGSFVRSDASPPGRGRGGWYAGALLLFVLAALSKSSVVMLPCVLLLLAWWRRGTISRVDLAKSAPFFLVSFIAGLATIWFHRHRAMDVNDPQMIQPLLERLLIAGHALLFYLGKALVPVRLSMIYPRWGVDPRSLIAYLPPVVIAGLVAAAWKYRECWRRGPAAVLAYFLLTLLPVSGLLPAALFKHSDVFDHLAYLATIGMTAGLAAMLTHWRTTRNGAYPAVAMIVVTGLFVLGSLQRASDFSSSEALWRSTLNVDPDSAAAHNNLGLALFDEKRFPEAAAQFNAALALDPHLSAAASNLARLRQDQGAWREAASLYAEALARTPDARDYNNYGTVLMELGEAAPAGEQFRRSARMEPRMLSPHVNLYKVALSQGSVPDAVNELDACLRLEPDDVPSLLALAVLDVQAAAPGDTPPDAVTLVERVCRLTGSLDPISREILAHAGDHPARDGAPARMPAVVARIQAVVGRL